MIKILMKLTLGILGLPTIIILTCISAPQAFAAYMTNTHFVPSYDKIDLERYYFKESLEESDYQLIYSQTGLGALGVNEVIDSYNGLTILEELQNATFSKATVIPTAMIGRFTCEDIAYGQKPDFIGLEPGDILVTTSTYSMGWRHGHAGIVVEVEGELKLLESAMLGQTSSINSLDNWKRYSNFVVLRAKELDEDERYEVSEFAKRELVNKKYSILSDILPYDEDKEFKGHCFYIVWYAYKKFGVDIDFDGGLIVTARDIMKSKELEVVQSYGIDTTEIS